MHDAQCDSLCESLFSDAWGACLSYARVANHYCCPVLNAQPPLEPGTYVEAKPIQLTTAATRYSVIGYWNRRYTQVGSYDWYQRYPALKSIVNEHIEKTAKVVFAGCGNSMMPDEMALDGTLTTLCPCHVQPRNP